MDIKYSPVAHLTYGLIGDTDILQTAPQDLIQAGYGDVVGKITAITDWDLSVKANGDYRCDTCVTLVKRALDKCFDKAEGSGQIRDVHTVPPLHFFLWKADIACRSSFRSALLF